MTNLEEIFRIREIAKKEKDLDALYMCAIQMSEEFNSDNERIEAAYFLGRKKDYNGFGKLLENAQARSFGIAARNRTYDEEHRFFRIGLNYPNLDESDLDLMEKKYKTSGDYRMMDRILFDQERLPRVLEHFDASALEIQNTEFSDELLDKVFQAAWMNDFEMNIQEAIDNRYNAKTQNETWGRAFGFEYDPSKEPIFVYNRKTNNVEIDCSDLSDIMLFPIQNLGRIGGVVEAYGKYFGHEIKDYLISEIMPQIGLPFGWRSAIYHSSWYRSIHHAVIKKTGIDGKDPRYTQIRRDIAKAWLIEINNKSLI